MGGGLSGDNLYVLIVSFVLSSLAVVNTIVSMDVRKDRYGFSQHKVHATFSTHNISLPPLSALASFESDASNRSMAPSFYGVIPSTGRRRGLVINALRMMVFSQFGITMIKITLMSSTFGTGVLLTYLLTRQVVWHLIKLLRGDWTYW